MHAKFSSLYIYFFTPTSVSMWLEKICVVLPTLFFSWGSWSHSSGWDRSGLHSSDVGRSWLEGAFWGPPQTGLWVPVTTPGLCSAGTWHSSPRCLCQESRRQGSPKGQDGGALFCWSKGGPSKWRWESVQDPFTTVIITWVPKAL